MKSTVSSAGAKGSKNKIIIRVRGNRCGAGHLQSAMITRHSLYIKTSLQPGDRVQTIFSSNENNND